MSKKEATFEEFSGVSLKQWEEKITKDLKGKSISELEWTNQDNITLVPYVNEENSKNYSNSESSSKSKPNTKINEWTINKFIKISSENEANKEAVKALSEGVNSLTFRGDDIDLEVLLKDIMIEIIAVHFIVRNPVKLITDLKKLCLNRAITFVDLEASISFDYLGNYARKGTWLSSKEQITSDLIATFEKAKDADVKTICASNSYFQKSGATVSQQIGIALAQGTEYLNLLTPHFSVNELAKKMQFEIAIGNNYFLEIAKLRTFRMLWEKVLIAFGSTESNTIINTSTSTLYWSDKQPKNNMLRATSQSMSAILGGCDSLTISSFDSVSDNKKSYSNRIASNVQLILKEESYFDKVVDPANGSYFIENLTEELAEKSWLFFQEIEKNGGYIKALEGNYIQEKVFESGEKLMKLYNQGKTTLVGVNKYETEERVVSMKRETEQKMVDNNTLSFLHIK
ncbi:methylmalonyl-CoA mutase family protein [Flavobacteriales bacterium]|nr:methylmalonyl-CoA mutase family protein [Flavobacteriales bacterium]